MSPLQKIAHVRIHIPTNKMEVINPYAITPWEEQISVNIDPDKKKAAMAAKSVYGIRIATGSSERRGIVRMGEAIQDTLGNIPNGEPVTYSVT